MNAKSPAFLSKLHDFVFIGAILFLIIIQSLVRKFLGFNEADSISIWLDFGFNFLLSLCLFGFYLKKYNPDGIRKIFMAIFLMELISGILLKKFQIQYSSEILFIGLIGVLIIWLNTHLRRKQFLEEND